MNSKKKNWFKLTGEAETSADIVYSVRAFFNWTNAGFKVRRTSDDAIKYVFFHTSGVVTTSSFVSDSNTTPSATTLSSWLGSSNAVTVEWLGQSPDNIINTDFIAKQAVFLRQPRLATAGVIETKNGKPAIKFSSSVQFLETFNEFPPLDLTESATIITVSSNDVSSGIGVIWCTSESGNGTRLVVYNDRRTNKAHTLIENSVNAQFRANLLAQINSSNQRISTTIKTATTITSRYNGVFQESNSWTGIYNNINFRIGVQHSLLTTLQGAIQEIQLFDGDITDELTTVEGEVDSFFSIP